MASIWDALDPDDYRGAFGTGSPAEAAQTPNPLAEMLLGLFKGEPAIKSDPNSPVAYKTASPLVNITEQDISNGINAGMGVSGGGLTTKPIRAYHGSPHDFDRFDLSKIGTGEGAQAYGHGLYFAEAEPVAKAYRDQLSYMNKSLNGQRFYGNESPAHGILSEALDAGTGIDGAIAKAARTYEDFTKGPNASYRNAQTAKQALDQLQEWKSSANIAHDPGKMYEVNINADPAHFLDWDKPLAAQPKIHEALINAARDPAYERIREARWNLPNVTGGYADNISAGTKYRALDSPDMVTASLREQGVPGIKYLDQGSRNAGTGTNNYVVFNPDSPISRVDIIRKYGIAGLPAAGIVASAVDHDPFGSAGPRWEPVDYDPFQ